MLCTSTPSLLFSLVDVDFPAERGAVEPTKERRRNGNGGGGGGGGGRSFVAQQDVRKRALQTQMASRASNAPYGKENETQAAAVPVGRPRRRCDDNEGFVAPAQQSEEEKLFGRRMRHDMLLLARLL
jgi:hypothetical protein